MVQAGAVSLSIDPTSIGRDMGSDVMIAQGETKTASRCLSTNKS